MKRENKSVEAKTSSHNTRAVAVTLSTHPQFIALIEQSRGRQQREGGISGAEMRRRLGIT
jgi:hypothetical protein